LSSSSIDPTVFAVVTQTPSVLRCLVDQLPTAVVEAAVDQGWSPRHVIAHVLDTEDVIVGRMQRIVVEERPFIRSIDPPARLAAGGYLERTAESLLTELQIRRAQGIEWLQERGDELSRTGDHDEAGVISAADIAHQWAYHDLMHIQQLTRMVQERLALRMGNTRLFYTDV
jgi:hypothetical protein